MTFKESFISLLSLFLTRTTYIALPFAVHTIFTEINLAPFTRRLSGYKMTSFKNTLLVAAFGAYITSAIAQCTMQNFSVESVTCSSSSVCDENIDADVSVGNGNVVSNPLQS